MSERRQSFGPGSIALLEVMRRHPLGTQFYSGDLSRMARIQRENFTYASKALIFAGLMLQKKITPRLSLWSLSDAGATAEVRAAPCPARGVERIQRDEMPEAPSPIVYGSMRDFLATGDHVVTGDPLRGLVEAIDAARKVLAAKNNPGARFKGAEVDLLVARELRQISEAAERAKVNLAQALEVMS